MIIVLQGTKRVFWGPQDNLCVDLVFFWPFLGVFWLKLEQKSYFFYFFRLFWLCFYRNLSFIIVQGPLEVDLCSTDRFSFFSIFGQNLVKSQKLQGQKKICSPPCARASLRKIVPGDHIWWYLSQNQPSKHLVTEPSGCPLLQIKWS